MTETDRLRYLRIALLVTGFIFLLGVLPLSIVWPSGWVWHAGGRSEYFEMILVVYATLGIFLIRASRDPAANASLIWFAAWSSIAHAAVMALQAVIDGQHTPHLWGDVPALLIVGGVLAWLAPRAMAARDGATRVATA